jgi:hypothetical protein
MIVPHNFTVFGFEFARMVVSCDFILDIPHTFELCFKFDLHNYALHRVPVRRRRNSRAAVPLFIVRGTEMGMNNGHQQDGITIHKKPKTFTNHSNHRRSRKKHRRQLFRLYRWTRGRRNAGADGGGQRERASLAGREAVEQQVERGVGHGAAAPPDVPVPGSGRGGSLLHCRGRRLLISSELPLLLPQSWPRLAVTGSSRRRLPRPLHNRGELADAEPQVGKVGRRRR